MWFPLAKLSLIFKFLGVLSEVRGNLLFRRVLKKVIIFKANEPYAKLTFANSGVFFFLSKKTLLKGAVLM